MSYGKSFSAIVLTKNPWLLRKETNCYFIKLLLNFIFSKYLLFEFWKKSLQHRLDDLEDTIKVLLRMQKLLMNGIKSLKMRCVILPEPLYMFSLGNISLHIWFLFRCLSTNYPLQLSWWIISNIIVHIKVYNLIYF